MSATNRKTVRDGLTALLQSGLVGVSLPAQAVYGYAVGDFQGQSPVVRVLSAGTAREEATYDTDTYNTFFLTIEAWVVKADPASSWTEANAEDRLDLIEKSIADILAANYSHASGLWDRIGYEGRSQVYDGIVVGGDAYLLEVINIRIEKDDT